MAMSARGASARADLFESDTPKQVVEEVDEGIPMNEVLGTPRPEDDPLQLEHMIGYAGLFKHTVIAVPNRSNVFIKSMGCNVTIENLDDQFDQKYLRGHDMQISALAVSRSGNLIASGQNGTIAYKGNAAPIFVWDVNTQRRVTALRGLTMRVNAVAFSTDERFLCGMGEDCLLYIWELATGEVVYGTKLPCPASVLTWVEHKQENRRVSYELAIGFKNTVFRGDLIYDLGRVQWSLNLVPYAMPPGGSIIRCFTDVIASPDLTSIYVGTTGGEVMIYRRGATVFRACIPVCTQGVSCLMADPTTGNIICGGGDGTIHVLEGADMGWRVKSKTIVSATVRAMSLLQRPEGIRAGEPASIDFLLGCSDGTLYCCNNATESGALSTYIIQEGHTSSITALAFDTTEGAFAGSDDKSHYFVTGTSSGELRGWDLIDYHCVGVTSAPKKGSVLSLIFLDHSKVLVGWEDGSIHCMDFPSLNSTLWYIAVAHRDGTTSMGLAMTKSVHYMVSGGNDSTVRVWKLSNRELVTQFSEHKKGVTKVLVDVKSPNIIHSCGMDGVVGSYDLKTNKRLNCHMINTGGLMDMTQRFDAKSEIELVTCDRQGKLLQWDIDVRDAVDAIQDPVRKILRCCSVSPSGRYLVFSGDDAYLKIIDITTNHVVSLGQGHSGTVNTLCWTPGKPICTCIAFYRISMLYT